MIGGILRDHAAEEGTGAIEDLINCLNWFSSAAVIV